jgi:putative transposase
MNNELCFFRRNLPHLHPSEGTFFITFCLVNAMPRDKVLTLRSNLESSLQAIEKTTSSRDLAQMTRNIHKIHFNRLDELMAQSKTNAWLKRKSIAGIVEGKMKEFDGKRYDLVSYCIMPNHVHLLIKQKDALVDQSWHKSYLSTTMNLLKGSTARLCNIALGRSGRFWHDESYDHLVRDGKELFNICQYIINNPVKAGLVDDWPEWPFIFLANEHKM